MTRPIMSDTEVQVLNTLEKKRVGNEPISEISELSSLSGIKNNEEVQRTLYILEGRSLVQPEPKGDLTSSQWSITAVGVKALDFIQQEQAS